MLGKPGLRTLLVAVILAIGSLGAPAPALAATASSEFASKPSRANSSRAASTRALVVASLRSAWDRLDCFVGTD